MHTHYVPTLNAVIEHLQSLRGSAQADMRMLLLSSDTEERQLFAFNCFSSSRAGAVCRQCIPRPGEISSFHPSFLCK